jgi:predicted TIM-barrel fold metal-dependent hydrolase
MDRLGVDAAVLSLPPVGVLPERGLLRDLMAAANDGLLEACGTHPDRFVMLASVALPDAAAAIAEVDRLAGASALRGLTFPSQATLHRPDQIGLEHVLARAADLRLVTLIHPSGANTDLGSVFDDFELGLAMHAMISGPVVVARIIASGMFDRIPGCEIIAPNLGGILPFIAARLDDRLRGAMERTPSDYLRTSVFYDTSGFPSGPAYRCALEYAGASQLVLGTDYPSWTMTPAWEALDAMNLPTAERAAIAGANALRWFDPARAAVT